MGNTEKNPRQFVIAIIPARLFSTRLPGKLLLDLGGKPLILHTLEQTKKAENIDRVIVATDSEEILRVVKASGNEAVLTSLEHQSGSDRIAEVAEGLPENSIIVNVQGDEPLIPKSTIEKAVEAILADETIDIATTCEPIEKAEDVLSSDVVKVVTDKNNFALYFSRSPIPFPREEVKKYGSLKDALQNEKKLLPLYRKHTGLYVYKREYLLKYTREQQTNLEKTEMLEQLRALENGARIRVVEVSESSIGVDTPEDFESVREIIEAGRLVSSSVIYREAKFEDIPQIAEVHVKSWQESFRGIVPQDYLDKISIKEHIKSFNEILSNTDYQSLVAENSDKKIVGFANFGKARNIDFGFDAELYAIYLLSEFQRRGIGGKLFKLLAEKLCEENCNSMYLEVLDVNPYKSFYKKMHGKIIGEGEHKLGKTLIYGWEDLSEI